MGLGGHLLVLDGTLTLHQSQIMLKASTGMYASRVF